MASLIVPVPSVMTTFPSTRGRLAFVGVPDDTHMSNPNKGLSGHVRGTDGAPIQGATVVLYRQYDNVAVRTTTSGENGVYFFQRNQGDTNTYYAVAFSVVNGNVQIHGVSNRGRVPA